jgi:hypothetical protein
MRRSLGVLRALVMIVLLLVCCDNTACSMVVWGCDEKPEDDVTLVCWLSLVVNQEVWEIMLATLAEACQLCICCI